MFQSIVDWLASTILALGYPGITLLMALESSFFPFPSEVVLPPAGYLAAQGRMNAWLALTAGIAGSLLGALFNYAVAVRLGRPLLHRYGRYILIKEASLNRAEAFFRKHGEISTFVGRLIPLIRQYISLPAGLARMRLDRFAAYTSLGAGIWCAVLTWIGWYLGRHLSSTETANLQPYVHRYTLWATLALVPLLAITIAVYVIRQKESAKSADAGQGET